MPCALMHTITSKILTCNCVLKTSWKQTGSLLSLTWACSGVFFFLFVTCLFISSLFPVLFERFLVLYCLVLICTAFLFPVVVNLCPVVCFTLKFFTCVRLFLFTKLSRFTVSNHSSMSCKFPEYFSYCFGFAWPFSVLDLSLLHFQVSLPFADWFVHKIAQELI